MNAGEPYDTDETAGPKRKLAAILHADVAGYSRLMGEDESGTYTQLMTARRLIEAVIARHEGRIVGTAGDAVLADFPSVIEALTAAVDIQSDLAACRAEQPTGAPLQFRIGINIGDVIIGGDDIFGDGVNVAARVESLAEPGGIAISGAAYDQVKNKLDLQYRPLGAHRVKNIAEPITVYAVGRAGDEPALVKPRPGLRWGTTARTLAALAASALVVGAVALVDPFSWFGQGSGSEGTSQARTGEPTIAVLPFENRSGDPEQDYFSAGVSEDVISSLGRFSNLLVLSWNAVAPYAGMTAPPEQLSQELGVRYLVGGSVWRVGDQLRVTVQLTDAEHGVLLWSERYEGKVDDVFLVQDQIVRQVVGALAVRVTLLEQERAFERPTEDLDAYDRVLRGRDQLRRTEWASNLEARALFEQARALDPDYADAYVGLALTYAQDFLFGWSEWPQRAIERTGDLAQAAIELDDRNAQAHALLAFSLIYQQQPDRAALEAERALDLNPNDVQALAIKGVILNMRGESSAAVEALEHAIRLDPEPILWWVNNLAEAYYLLERYQDAVTLLESYRHQFYEDPGPLVVLAASLAQLGREAEVRETVEALAQLSPFFRAEDYVSTFSKAEHRAHMLEGLRRAGLE